MNNKNYHTVRTVLKSNKNYHTVRTVLKYNKKIIETEVKLIPPNTHVNVHNH